MVPPTPLTKVLTKAPAPARPPPPSYAEHERNMSQQHLLEIEARKAGQAELMVTPKSKQPAVEGEKSARALKRARQKLASSVVPPGEARAGSSNEHKQSPIPSPAATATPTSIAGVSYVSLSDEDDEDAKAERALEAQLAALRFKKAAVKAMAAIVAEEKMETGVEEKGEGLYRSERVGSTPDSETPAGTKDDCINGAETAVKEKGGGLNRFERVGLNLDSDMAADTEEKPAKQKNKKDQGPRQATSNRRIFKGVGKGAAARKDLDPWLFVGENKDPHEIDLGGCGAQEFYPPRGLSEEEAIAHMKILTCCHCGSGPLLQSTMVLSGGGTKASWQGKLFGWCHGCMPDLSAQEFKAQARCTWSVRKTELGMSRTRALFTDFDNAMASIRADFKHASQAVCRELAAKRCKAACAAWACSIAKDNKFMQEARAMATDDYMKVVDIELENPEYAASPDGRCLKARELSWLTNMGEGMALCYCCRRPDCGYFGMNSQWLNLEGTNRFRCPFCIDEYKPTSVVNGQVSWSFVLYLTDPSTGQQMSIPAMWPEGKDMAWLHKQIEVYALAIASEVELANYVNRGAVDMSKLLSQEAVPRGFSNVPFAGHSNADVGRMAWEPRWHVEEWTARGFSEGARLDPTVDDLSHPFDNWGHFIALAGRISAEARKGSPITGAEVMRRMGD